MADIHTGSEGLAEPLTDREQEILACLAEGLSNREIAERLHLALRTVKWYNTQIYSKLGVNNRNEAIAQAMDLGFFSSTTESTSVETRHNLPAQTTLFIGRQSELSTLARLLSESRLVTILAPGGMGKTRLSLAAAEAQLARFTDGVFFVPLAPLSSPNDILTAIAENVGFDFSGPDLPQQQLIEYLRQRNVLLLLDNFEHLLDGAALVTDILRAAPQVKVLATSREKLSLSGETVFTLTGLEFPAWETPEDALEYDAVKLFMQSAQRVRPDFVLQTDDLDYLARICRLTAGMPLGLVLAAAWLDMLTLAQIAAEIQQGIDILETGQRDVPERQRSVRASFNYSWARLTEAERDVFMKLSIFRGGFTAEAAEAVAGANLRQLRRVVDKALVQALPSGRYEVHELLRQFGEEQLTQSGAATQLRAAHLSYFTNFMYERGQDIKGRRQVAGLNDVAADLDNVRVAWDRAIDQADLNALDQMGECLALYCPLRVRYHEAEALFSRAMQPLLEKYEVSRHPALNRLRLHWLRAWLLQRQNYTPASIHEQLARSLEVAREQDDQITIAWCLLTQGNLDIKTGSYDTALPHFEHSLTHFQNLGDDYGVARALAGKADYYWFAVDDPSQFETHNQQSLDWARDIGDRAGMHEAYLMAGSMYERTGKLADAARQFRESEILCKELGYQRFFGIMIAVQSFYQLFRGQFADARQRADEALKVSSDMNYRDMLGRVQSIKGFIAAVEGDCDTGRRLGQQAVVNSGWDFDNCAERTLSLVAMGDGDFEQAQQRIVQALQMLRQEFRLLEAVQWCAIAVPVLAQAGKSVRAAEVLGLVASQSDELTGWLEHWQLLTDLQSDLDAELGAKAYVAAFEAGAQLEIENVVNILLADFKAT